VKPQKNAWAKDDATARQKTGQQVLKIKRKGENAYVKVKKAGPSRGAFWAYETRGNRNGGAFTRQKDSSHPVKAKLEVGG